MGGGRGKVRLMFQDEAGFGRISKPAACWVTGKMRPIIASQQVREYRYAFGAVDPKDGEKFFIIAPKCNSEWMNAFFIELSKAYPDDYIILVMDNAPWHVSGKIELPNNIEIVNIPPYTPQMNPIEQIWKELRKGFANKFFHTLQDVMNNLDLQIKNLSRNSIISITYRDWLKRFY
jgi:transposase